MSIERYAAFLPQSRQDAVFAHPVSAGYLPLGGFNVHALIRANPHAPSRTVLVHAAGGYSDTLWPLAA